MDIDAQLIPWRELKGWNCIHCGRCCRSYDVPLTPEDEERLKKYGSVFRKGRVGLYLKKKKGKCVFRRDKCRIYTERPVACRLYPFYVRFECSKDAYFNGYYVYIDAECRGVDKGCLINLLQWIQYVIKIKINRNYIL